MAPNALAPAGLPNALAAALLVPLPNAEAEPKALDWPNGFGPPPPPPPNAEGGGKCALTEAAPSRSATSTTLRMLKFAVVAVCASVLQEELAHRHPEQGQYVVFEPRRAHRVAESGGRPLRTMQRSFLILAERKSEKSRLMVLVLVSFLSPKRVCPEFRTHFLGCISPLLLD